VENPMLVLIMGCVGLVLNIISVTFLHGMKFLYYLRQSKAEVRYPLEHDQEGTQEHPAAVETDNSIELSTLQDVSAFFPR
jgi:zinc transporter 1